MGASLLPDLGTEILIPVCAVVGICFSLFQWLLVSKVKLSPAEESHSSNNNNNKKNGYTDYLVEEEEGLNDHNVVLKCAEIQNAISEGPFFSSVSLSFICVRAIVVSVFLDFSSVLF